MRLSTTNAVCCGLIGAMVTVMVTPGHSEAHDFRGLRRMFRQPEDSNQQLRENAFQNLRELLRTHNSTDAAAFQTLDAHTFGWIQSLSVWPRGHQLKICFFKDPDFARWHSSRSLVLKLYGEILVNTTLTAKDVGICGKQDADLRVVFKNTDGDWSDVGVEARKEKLNMPTMGLNSLAKEGPTADAIGTTRHEILHSVGLEHEHQRPDIDCGFVSPFIIKRNLARDGEIWTIPEIKNNFNKIKSYLSLCKAYTKISKKCDYYTEFDKNSVMLYQLDKAYFKRGHYSECYIRNQNNELSDLDINTLKLTYQK
jgi:Astacin (Peptidase family M12A)